MSNSIKRKNKWNEIFGVEASYSAETMIGNAIANARPEKDLPRWIVVKTLFLYGQTTSRKICEFYGLDPDEIVQAKLTE
jgi:hypothetical protein